MGAWSHLGSIVVLGERAGAWGGKEERANWRRLYGQMFSAGADPSAGPWFPPTRIVFCSVLTCDHSTRPFLSCRLSLDFYSSQAILTTMLHQQCSILHLAKAFLAFDHLQMAHTYLHMVSNHGRWALII